MIKRAIKLSSFLCAFIVSLLIFQNVTMSQQRMPMGTTNQIDLDFSETTISKARIISDLNRITDETKATLLKTSVDSNNYQHKKDIIWFGFRKPKSNKLITENNDIHWFDTSLEGTLIASQNIGVRPLSGTYAVTGDQKFFAELNQWAKNHHVLYSQFEKPSLLNLVFSYLFLNGAGNAALAAFLLLLTTIITWLVSHAKGRSIRLLGGINVKKIHREDLQTIIAFVLVGFFVGGSVALGYVGISNGIRQIKLVALQTLGALFVMLLLTSFCTVMFSIIASPKPEQIAKREIPLKRFNLLGQLNRVVIVIIALIVIPTTLNAAMVTYKLSNEHALWSKMQNFVRISFNDTNTLASEAMQSEVEIFLKEMSQAKNLQLSFVVDRAIQLEKSEMGGYDHIILADRAWIASFGVGTDKVGKAGKLTSKSLDSLPVELAEFLKVQLPVWTKNGEVQPKGISFYEYSGGKFLALPPNAGIGDETIQAKQPLVILADNPTALFTIDGLLLPLVSTGNIVFPNEDKLQSALAHSQIKPYVSSVDGIADKALETAQKFKQESIYYIIACILILIALFSAGILSGKMWAGMNKKRIFTLHTFGISYRSIIQPVLKKEFLLAVVTTLVGSVIAFSIHHTQLNLMLLVALLVLLLYLLGSVAAYQIYTRQTFKLASQREH